MRVAERREGEQRIQVGGILVRSLVETLSNVDESTLLQKLQGTPYTFVRSSNLS
jgi:hypothetical protein